MRFVYSDSSELTVDLDGVDWDSILEGEPENTCLLRMTGQRKVMAVHYRGRDLVIKAYYRGGGIEDLKRLFRGPLGKREFEIAELAQRLGLPTFSPIGYGYRPLRCDFGILKGAGRSSNQLELDSVFVAERISGIPLKRFIKEIRENLGEDSYYAQKRELIESLSHLFATMHSSGFIHTDLHSENILVDKTSLGLRCYVVDLLSLKHCGAVSDRACIYNIAALASEFYPEFSGSKKDIVRFVKSYLTYRKRLSEGSSSLSSKALLYRWLEGLRWAVRAHKRRAVRKKLKRIWGDGKYFSRISLPGSWYFISVIRTKHSRSYSQATSVVFSPEDWKTVLGKPQEFIERFSKIGIIYKNSRSSFVFGADLPFPLGKLACVVKLLKRRRFHYAIVDGKPCVEWKWGWMLWFYGIPIATPLAVVQDRLFPFRGFCFLIVERIARSVSLYKLVNEYFEHISEDLLFRLKCRLIDRLAFWVKYMVLCGIFYKDLKPSNILVVQLPSDVLKKDTLGAGTGSDRKEASDAGFDFDIGNLDPDATEIVFIDAESARLSRRDPLIVSARMLARFSFVADLSSKITIRDRVRFLKKFIAAIEPMEEIDWKELWRLIEDFRRRYFKGHRPG